MDFLSNEIEQLVSLWQEAFGDTREDVEAFINTLYSPKNTIVLKENGEIVSAVYLVDAQISSEDGNTLNGYYFCCAATRKSCRGKGLMSQIIERVKQTGKDRGKDFIALIPANQSLFDFYARFGFVDYFYCEQKVFEIIPGRINDISFEIAEEAEKLCRIQNTVAKLSKGNIIKSKAIFDYTILDGKLSGYKIYFIKNKGEIDGYLIYDGENLVREIITETVDMKSAINEFLYLKNLKRIEVRLPNNDLNGKRKGVIFTFTDKIDTKNITKTAFINQLLEA